MSQTERQKEEAAENASNKRKWESNHNGSLSQQNKGHKVPRAHTAWPINKKAYAGPLPLRNQFKSHYSGQCTVKCGNCKEPNKRQNTGIAYTARHGEKKHYSGSKPLCYKYNYHHDGPCAPKCHQCNRVGHQAQDCSSPAATNNQRNLTCYECRNQRHYRSDCPELKNQNH
nr:hypothetical protein [Tanacetum cinerariifolium]